MNKTNPLIFGSKKATIAVLGALITFLLTVLPIFLPDVPVEIWQDAADMIMKIVIVYLAAQGTADAAKAFKADIEPVSS